MVKLLISFLLLISATVHAQRPVLKGGLEDFVKNNTIYPPYSLHNCIQGIVTVAFKVNENGEVYYSGITNGVGADLDDEALRLIKMTSKKWTVPDDHDTTTMLVVPVNFSLSGYDCNRKTKAEITMAINAYKNEEELFNVVQNYYRNIENGTVKNNDDEGRILTLKAELGVDDEYLDAKISSGLKKYNQGDKQGACKEFIFIKYMGSKKADDYIAKYCK